MPKNQPELKLIALEDVVVEPVRWLWYPYIPLGKLPILHGDPCEGKTTLALWIAAACSRGQALPGGETGVPLTVLYQTAEDGLGDTIKPWQMCIRDRHRPAGTSHRSTGHCRP